METVAPGRGAHVSVREISTHAKSKEPRARPWSRRGPDQQAQRYGCVGVETARSADRRDHGQINLCIERHIESARAGEAGAALRVRVEVKGLPSGQAGTARSSRKSSISTALQRVVAALNSLRQAIQVSASITSRLQRSAAEAVDDAKCPKVPRAAAEAASSGQAA